MNQVLFAFAILCASLFVRSACAEEPEAAAEAAARAYLRARVAEINQNEPAEADTLEEWQAKREELRRQLFDMLGLWPMPEKSDLKATVTGTVERDGIVVEKLHYQSLPGLYVTANFFRPKVVEGRLPTILYLAGHAEAVENRVSYGNKTSYHHHACWFAQNGYCCLMIDTLQLGEIQGLHHGTHREGMWWWVSRGYTPAGVEAWNGIRALDYLESRPEVDATKIGVTGRSGGGAYSWYVAALDERPSCVVPVAGITDLQDHVVERCITGHCDCMYMVNQYQWDFATLAALIAPRPLLLANTDKDRIFPLGGIVRVHEKLRRIYALYDATDKLGLFVSEGPHADTQELQLAAFRWMNRWLRGTNDPVADVAEKQFAREELRVFAELPQDQRNTRIHEEFVPAAKTEPTPSSLPEWEKRRGELLEELKLRSFAAWPNAPPELQARIVAEDVIGKLRLRIVDFQSDAQTSLRLWAISRAGDNAIQHAKLIVADNALWDERIGDLLADTDAISDKIEGAELLVIASPRGWGPNRWPAKGQNHLLRSFVLVGTTADALRIWDTRRAVQAVRAVLSDSASLTLEGAADAASVALYAGIFEPSVADLSLAGLPSSHRDGATLIGVSRVLDVPQAVGLFMPRAVRIENGVMADWSWPLLLAKLNSQPFLTITE